MKETIPYELLARYFSGECTEKDKNEVERWKNKNKTNEKAFSEFAAIWYNSETVQTGFYPDTSDALDKVNMKIERTEKQSFDKQKHRGFIYFAARIAALFILSLAIWYGYNKVMVEDSLVTEVNNGKEIKELLLPDGTKITLNSNSRVSFHEKFGKKSRDVELEGEAFFEVARNAESPFTLRTQNSVTQVLGTSFNLRARPEEDEVILSVADGKVAFSSRKNEQTAKATLEAGETAILNIPVNAITETKSEDMNYMAWKTGILRFNNTPLGNVAKDLSKFYHTLFYVENSGLDSVKINIEINNMTVDKMIEAMEIIGIQIKNTGNGYVIIPAESQ